MLLLWQKFDVALIATILLSDRYKAFYLQRPLEKSSKIIWNHHFFHSKFALRKRSTQQKNGANDKLINTIMKKKMLMILMSGMMLMPTSAMAQDDGGGHGSGGGGNGPYYSPGVSLGAIITYNESSNIAYVWFTTAVDDAEITICIDNVVVDTQTFDVVAGSQIPFNMSVYGSGEVTIYVRRGTTLLAYYTTSI